MIQPRASISSKSSTSKARAESSKAAVALRAALRSVLGVLALMSIMFITACAKSNEPFQPDNQTSTFVLTLPDYQAGQAEASAELLCELKGGVCPPAMAMMLTRTNAGTNATYKQCTSFLVAPDIMATNSHCLPEAMRRSDFSCANVKFYFGKTLDRKAETASCSKVIVASSITEDPKSPRYLQEPDYAFLKLDKAVKRRPFEMSRKGLPDDTQLKVFVIDPKPRSGPLGGVLKLKNCSVTHSNFLNPRAPGDFANVMSGPCAIIPGNSGSPVLDAEASVRGLIQGIWLPETIKRESFRGVDLPKRFTGMSVMTNVACIEPVAGALGNLAHADCASTPLTQRQLIDSAIGNASENFETSFAAWTKSAPPLFKYALKTSRSEKSSVSFPVLSCVQKSDEWIKTTTAAAAGLESLSLSEDLVTAQLKAPIWGRKAAISQSFKVTGVSGVTEMAAMTVEFDLSSMRLRPYVKTQFKLVGSMFNYKTSIYDLPICDR